MKLYVVGFGPGNYEGMTLEAMSAIEKSSLVVGYSTYTDIIKQYFPEKEYLSTGMRKEKERVMLALENAVTKTVALICSGDSQLYGMAGLAFELGGSFLDVEIEVVAGVTAAFSGGAILGAPITHDCALISLSDLLTPIGKIEKRLRCASEGDFVIALYNPSSNTRVDYLKKACDIVLKYRDENTPCGVVRNIGREGQDSRIMTLKELKDMTVDMFTTVYIGNSETKIINGKIVTPRGYQNA